MPATIPKTPDLTGTRERGSYSLVERPSPSCPSVFYLFSDLSFTLPMPCAPEAKRFVFYSFEPPSSLECKFRVLADKWKAETGKLSATQLKYLDRSYHQILAMGQAAIPCILDELRRSPAWWFDALEVLTGEDPARGAESFQETVDAWLAWGEENGFAA